MGLDGTNFMKMKKIVVLSVFTSIVSVVSAQTTRYDVNVYTNPPKLVTYTPLMGNAYKSYMEGWKDIYKMNESHRLERERLENEKEREWQQQGMELNRMKMLQAQEGMKIASDEIKMLNGTNLATKVLFPIKVRVVKRNNGSVDMSCLGIKKGDVWVPCNKKLISLREMYNSAVNDKEKSTILGLMDYGSYMLDTDNEVYILT